MKTAKGFGRRRRRNDTKKKLKLDSVNINTDFIQSTNEKKEICRNTLNSDNLSLAIPTSTATTRGDLSMLGILDSTSPLTSLSLEVENTTIKHNEVNINGDFNSKINRRVRARSRKTRKSLVDLIYEERESIFGCD